MKELLTWIAVRPRTYGETMQAWRTSCPRMPVWEDAVGGGLIHVMHTEGVDMNQSMVKLTASGRAFLETLT